MFFRLATIVTHVGYVGWAAVNDRTLPEFGRVGLLG